MDLSSVRRLASSEGLQEAYFNATSRVVSFAWPGEEFDRVRFNVYYTTGSVGTCINHPRQGRTQLFRRNVTLDMLREIFRNPRVHTGTGYHRKANDPQQGQSGPKRLRLSNGSSAARHHRQEFEIGSRAYVKGFANCTVLSHVLGPGQPHSGKIQVQYDDRTIYHVDPGQLEEIMEEVFDEETAAKKEMAFLEQERDRLSEETRRVDEQMSVVQTILCSFEEERRKQAEAERLEKERLAKAELARQEKALKELKRVQRGKNLDFVLVSADHVSECFDETVTCISCADSCAIMLYENGGWAWTAGLPKLLHNKLNGRQLSLPKPTYVSIGSQDRYYIRFADGKSEWVGCDAMNETLNSSGSEVASVAFGEDWDTYFVVFQNGYWVWGGDVPQGLRDILEKRQRKSDLACVSLGPNGEYYLAAKNGRAWWGGMSAEALAHVRKYSDRVTYLDFADDTTYLFRYS